MDDPIVEKLLQPVDSQEYHPVALAHDSTVETFVNDTTINHEAADVSKPNTSTYWYDRLTDEGKALYDTWYGYLREGYQQIHLDISYDGRKQLFDDVWKAILNDHPELFWIATNGCDYKVCYYNDPALGTDVTHNFACPAEDIPSLAMQIDGTVQQFRSFVGNDTEPSRVVLKAAIWLSNRLTYDHDYGYQDQCLLSSFLTDRTVCAGYGMAYKMLLASYDIPCFTVLGYTRTVGDSRHIWNVVWIDGKWSSVDVTWLDDDENGYDWSYFMFETNENEPREVIGPVNMPQIERLGNIRSRGVQEQASLTEEYKEWAKSA